jgi:hypothetical protein
MSLHHRLTIVLQSVASLHLLMDHKVASITFQWNVLHAMESNSHLLQVVPDERFRDPFSGWRLHHLLDFTLRDLFTLRICYRLRVGILTAPGC